MTRRAELFSLLLVDAFAFSVAWYLYYLARFDWGWFGSTLVRPAAFIGPLLIITVYWILAFGFAGMYRERYAASRFDEIVSIVKVVTGGLLLLFFVLFVDQLDPGSAKQNLAFYWAALVLCVSTGRLLVRFVQKQFILRGKGLHRALVIGWSDQVEELFEEVARYPEAGLNIVGAIRMPREGQEHLHPRRSAVLAPAGAEMEQQIENVWPENEQRGVEALPDLIDELEVQDVLITLGSEDHAALLDVLQSCDGKDVALKLVPDFYTVIGGMARTEHMYGLPLIEVLPVPMPAWEQTTKRLIDILVSLVILLAGLPFWILIGLIIRLTSSGPAVYRQQRVGRRGSVFIMHKYRTMREDAEAETGPVWASANDTRYTPVGRWLRKTRLDEVPQFWDVLRGKMSLVGPRPERPYFVRRFRREIPLYNRRHRVTPGITGWAQVKWRYDQSVEDVRQKLKYDLFYIENMSLRMDFKILFRTIRTALTGQGQ